MNDSTRPPRKRLSAATLGGGAVIAAAAVGGVTGFMLGVNDTPTTTTRQVFVWGFILAMALGCLLSLPYWRRLDEAAREAHKAAWLWGGGAAYVVAAAVGAALMIAPEGFALPSVSERTDAAGRAADAILLTVFFQSIAYCVGWLIWWLRKR